MLVLTNVLFSQSADFVNVRCGAFGREKGWHLVRYQRDTQKALYERHFVKFQLSCSYFACVSYVQSSHVNMLMIHDHRRGGHEFYAL